MTVRKIIEIDTLKMLLLFQAEYIFTVFELMLQKRSLLKLCVTLRAFEKRQNVDILHQNQFDHITFFECYFFTKKMPLKYNFHTQKIMNFISYLTDDYLFFCQKIQNQHYQDIRMDIQYSAAVVLLLNT